MTASHFVARLKLALNCHKDLDHFQDARGQLIAALQLLFAVFKLSINDSNRFVILAFDRFDLGLALIGRDSKFEPFVLVDFSQNSVGDLLTFLCAFRSRRGSLTDQHIAQTVVGGPIQNRAFILTIFAQALDLFILDGTRPVIDLDAVTVKHPHFNDRTSHAGRQTQ